MDGLVVAATSKTAWQAAGGACAGFPSAQCLVAGGVMAFITWLRG